MPYLPLAVSEDALSRRLQNAGLKRIHQGKVRDTYYLSKDFLLVVATNRISIFDFVLGSLIPLKGEALTAETIFWLTRTSVIAKTPCGGHHLVAYGKSMETILQKNLRNDPALQRRGLIVHNLREGMIPYECVVRGYLTGSGWEEYSQKATLNGDLLPAGLHDGSKLPETRFTPTTKAERGHDEPITYQELTRQTNLKPDLAPMLKTASVGIYERALRYATTRGVIIADTKFEFGMRDGKLILADEVLTSDSSRLWKASDYEIAVAKKTAPPGYDKEPVRQYGKNVSTPFSDDNGRSIIGINKLSPLDREHQEFVGTVDISDGLRNLITHRNLEMSALLLEMPLGKFQEQEMGIAP